MTNLEPSLGWEGEVHRLRLLLKEQEEEASKLREQVNFATGMWSKETDQLRAFVQKVVDFSFTEVYQQTGYRGAIEAFVMLKREGRKILDGLSR